MTDPTSKPKVKIHVDSLRRRPIMEWLIAFSVFFIVTAFFCGRLMFNAVATDHSGLSSILFIFFAAALIKNLTDVLFVDFQVKMADSQIADLVELNNVRTFLKSSKSSLFKDHVNNLYEMSKRDIDVAQDNLVVIMQNKVFARVRLIEMASSMLITIGLIGTIVGLLAAVSGLDSVLQSIGKNQAEMLLGFRETVSGMGTAFYTTLVGAILGGIGLRILSNIVETNAEFLVGHLAELSEVYIVPSLKFAAKRREKDRSKDDDQAESQD